jgi:hypothetical protein
MAQQQCQQQPLSRLNNAALNALGAYRPVPPHPGYRPNPANDIERSLNLLIEANTELENDKIRQTNRQIGKGGPSGISNCRLVPIRREDGATPPYYLAFTKLSHLERFSAADIEAFAAFYDLRNNPWLRWQTSQNTPMAVHRAKILVFMGARKNWCRVRRYRYK